MTKSFGTQVAINIGRFFSIFFITLAVILGSLSVTSCDIWDLDIVAWMEEQKAKHEELKKTLTSISVTPKRTTYFVGESVSADDITVAATCYDGSKKHGFSMKNRTV